LAQFLLKPTLRNANNATQLNLYAILRILPIFYIYSAKRFLFLNIWHDICYAKPIYKSHLVIPVSVLEQHALSKKTLKSIKKIDFFYIHIVISKVWHGICIITSRNGL